jgi:hypothetical protein
MGLESALEPFSYLRFQASLDPKRASTSSLQARLFACIQGSKGKSSSRSEVTESRQNSPRPGLRTACRSYGRRRRMALQSSSCCNYNPFIKEREGLPSLRSPEILRPPYRNPRVVSCPIGPWAVIDPSASKIILILPAACSVEPHELLHPPHHTQKTCRYIPSTSTADI